MDATMDIATMDALTTRGVLGGRITVALAVMELGCKGRAQPLLAPMALVLVPSPLLCYCYGLFGACWMWN